MDDCMKVFLVLLIPTFFVQFVGGTVKPQAYSITGAPFAVAIYNKEDDDLYIQGGCMITNYVVLTLAHFMAQRFLVNKVGKFSDYFIVSGKSILLQKISNTYDVVDIYFGENVNIINEKDHYRGVALLKTSMPFLTGRPASLGNYMPALGTTVTAVGYGTASPNIKNMGELRDKLPDDQLVLQYANVLVIDCQLDRDIDNALCTEEGTFDAGDYGSGIVKEGKLIGLVGWFHGDKKCFNTPLHELDVWIMETAAWMEKKSSMPPETVPPPTTESLMSTTKSRASLVCPNLLPLLLLIAWSFYSTSVESTCIY